MCLFYTVRMPQIVKKCMAHRRSLTDRSMAARVLEGAPLSAVLGGDTGASEGASQGRRLSLMKRAGQSMSSGAATFTNTVRGGVNRMSKTMRRPSASDQGAPPSVEIPATNPASITLKRDGKMPRRTMKEMTYRPI